MTVAVQSPVTMDETNKDAADKDSVPYLGGEPSLLGEDVEREGVLKIVETLSEEEKSQLSDPSMPIRHFRAEKGNTTKAIAKLRKTLQWRESFGVSRILKCLDGDDQEMSDIIQEEHESGKIYVRGYDKDGRAMLYMRPARENTDNEDNNMKNLVFNLEKAVACTRRKSVELGAKVPLEKINLVIDYTGFKLKNAPPMSASKRTLDILQSHYPERMARAFTCHPPFVFRTFWTLIKPFVDPTTKEKVIFCHGKAGMANLTATVTHVDKVEESVGGTAIRDFDSKEYLSLKFDVSFDE